MRKVFHPWLFGLIGLIAAIATPLALFIDPGDSTADTPWEHVPKLAAPVDHSDLFFTKRI